VQRLDREGFDFVVDDRPSCLAKAREDAFHDDLVAFPDFNLPEANDFQGAGGVFQQKSIGRLALPVRRELDVGDLACDDHFLAVVLLRVREELGDFQEPGCVRGDREHDENEKRQGQAPKA